MRETPSALRSLIKPLLMLAFIIATGAMLGARCHPPNTRVIVFIQGIYTTYDGETQSTAVEGPRFSTLKAAFGGKSYPAERMLDFSYAGGTIDSQGRWLPTHYECEATDKVASVHLQTLEDMLQAYKDEHPKAHFALVGHSLGGYLAFQEGAREAARSEEERLDIDVVVTLDAPLKGVSADKKAIIDLIPCDKTYEAGAEIVAQGLDAGIGAQRAAEATAMAEAGVRLGTFGNGWDCLWNTGHCLPGQTWVDDSDTQTLPGQAATSTEYEISANPLFSHDAILGDAAAVHDVVTFVGAP